MHLERLYIKNFKNYTEVELKFSKDWNCFLGSNGGGKTNLLDAIHYLCLCKSYFHSTDNLNIRHDSNGFTVEGNFGKDTVKCMVEKGQRKAFFLNNNKYRKLADHIGLFPVVVIAPDDVDLVNGGSETRRRLIDSTLAQLDSIYLQDLQAYNKVLTQRNSTLRDFAQRRAFDESLLDSWDQQLIPLATSIYTKRTELIKEFIPLFEKYYKLLAEKTEVPKAVYRSDLLGTDFGELLRASRDKDRILQRTVVGIHRDELELSLQGYSVKRFGSQGQRKSILIALKLAKYELIHQKKGMLPVLLLDDLFDKLDRIRVERLLDLIVKGDFGQA